MKKIAEIKGCLPLCQEQMMLLKGGNRTNPNGNGRQVNEENNRSNGNGNANGRGNSAVEDDKRRERPGGGISTH